ncbi:hypothetical protein WJX84_011701 [Apatococcus fuscideae]|uniref:Uncharacterized protein n=1 Tax=Apatococcus fuscideae TaxID=2026836 RepID=A0AAW1T9I1_9CHLO
MAAGPAAPALIVFGDSYTDAGYAGYGIHQVIHAALSTPELDVGVYPVAPYRGGRLSNGLIFTEITATALGLELQSFSTANAGSGAVPTHIYVPLPFGDQTTEGAFAVPSALQQAQGYIALHGGSINAADIVLIFIGTNDYMFSQPPGNYSTPPVDQVIAAIHETMMLAYQAGAQRFVLVNLPPLETLPALPGPNPFGPTSTIAAESAGDAWFSAAVPPHNAALQTLASQFPTQQANASVLLYDIYTLWADVVATPANYGFKDSANPCLGLGQNNNLASGFANTICPQPDAYVYWDLVHPTRHFHSLIANDFLAKLGPQLQRI